MSEPRVVENESESTYEFSSVEERSLEWLALTTRLWGAFCVLAGGLLLAAGVGLAATIQGPYAATLGAAFCAIAAPQILSGRQYFVAARAFKAVTLTDGDDLGVLMTGFRMLAGAAQREALLGVVSFLTAAAAIAYGREITP